MSLPALDPAQLQAVRAFVGHLNALEWEPLAELLHPDFRHQYQPASIVPPDGKETRGKADFIGVLQHNLLVVFKFIKWTIVDETHGVDSVVLHLTSNGMSKSGREYGNEYMCTFKLQGDKITRLYEFVDSKYSSAYFGALRAE
ncbi:hypothetical protein GGX14DRAFT_570955 [Mycena pura]|uniref:SnoaL-like domain-containing protein n=1 Tax=Mycena pura TaxID=153505 RepID=A0AAD6V3X0_9AGAR|nr:hypothetical protein GGX14DRAFT_570955 [Mycena pura]